MKIALCQVLTILCFFGAPLDVLSGEHPARISTRIALKIAKAEIKRRGLQLPAGAVGRVEDSLIEVEFRTPRPIFTVTFSYLDRKHRRSNLYQVNVDKESGKIEDFLDMRFLIRIP